MYSGNLTNSIYVGDVYLVSHCEIFNDISINQYYNNDLVPPILVSKSEMYVNNTNSYRCH